MKGNLHQQHLTDEQFSDLLAGEQPHAETQAHLAACSYCRGELAAVKGSLQEFHALGTVWADAKAPAFVPVPSRWAVGLYSLPSWRAGLAALAISGVLAFHFATPGAHNTPHNAPASTAQAAAPSRAELASDNQLMQSINQELSYHAQVALPSAELHALGTQHGNRHLPEPLVD